MRELCHASRISSFFTSAGDRPSVIHGRSGGSPREERRAIHGGEEALAGDAIGRRLVAGDPLSR